MPRAGEQQARCVRVANTSPMSDHTCLHLHIVPEIARARRWPAGAHLVFGRCAPTRGADILRPHAGTVRTQENGTLPHGIWGTALGGGFRDGDEEAAGGLRVVEELDEGVIESGGEGDAVAELLAIAAAPAGDGAGGREAVCVGEEGDRGIVGVNSFRDDAGADGKAVPLTRIDPELERTQIERLGAVKAERNAREVEQALERLRTVPDDENVMPLLIDAVSRNVSVGEICDVFRARYGEYKEVM